MFLYCIAFFIKLAMNEYEARQNLVCSNSCICYCFIVFSSRIFRFVQLAQVEDMSELSDIELIQHMNMDLYRLTKLLNGDHFVIHICVSYYYHNDVFFS